MPSSTPRDEDQPRRRRREHHDRERDSTSSKKKHSSSSTKLHRQRSSSKDREQGRDSPRPATSERGSRKTSGIVPEMERRASAEMRPKTSYPAFSKVHSREAVHSKEDVSGSTATSNAPETSDVAQEKERRRNSTPPNGMNAMPARPPPSPPLTADNPTGSRSGSGGSIRKTADDARSSTENVRRSMDSPQRASPAKASRSQTSLRKETRFTESDVSSMPGAFPEDERRSTPTSGYRHTVSTESQPASVLTQNSQNTDGTDFSEDTQGTGTDSDATSIAPNQKATGLPADTMPPRSTSPYSPFAHEAKFLSRGQTPVIDVMGANAYTPQSAHSGFSLDPKTPMTAVPLPPPPPPPPPPPLVTGAQPPPRVDYLLKHGGLPSMIPRRLVMSGPPVQQYSMYQSPSIGQMAPIEEYSKLFNGLHKRLDDYLHVLRHNGSLAVATGYKSVARRLLDKLSQVFARDISSQRCDCVICRTTLQPSLSDEEDSGMSWGEILETVSGRRELPQWQPFTIAPDDHGGLGIARATFAPMQKIDVDVPEEYREHYIRQNQKTKKAVQSWLSQQPEFPSSPPDEADEDTLMFAMMTKLDAEQRNHFIALMHGQSSVSTSRAPTPAERPATASNVLQRARKALQRLYRLDKAPRDCESAMYLLNNPHLHGMVATLAEVNEQEWDILVSGRFDGFLWSGAEAPFPPSVSQFNSPVASRGPSRGPGAIPISRNTTPFSGMSGMSGFQPSRGPTPFSPLRNAMSPDDHMQQLYDQTPSMFPSRGPTPAPNGMGIPGVTPPAPVQLDEDTEIAVLAEVERNLFNDMERFEDAFEVLHSRAELVRQLLRERSAGLSMSSQMRRGSEASAIGVRLDTPASGVTDFEDDTDDDGLADMASLAPDDSASQISTNRRHRKRHERRTPAPVAEEDESTFEENTTPAKEVRHQGGRRSKY